MESFHVVIDNPKELSPMARLLDVLTKSGLLDSRVKWDDTGGTITLVVTGTEQDKKTFQDARFRIK